MARTESKMSIANPLMQDLKSSDNKTIASINVALENNPPSKNSEIKLQELIENVSIKDDDK